MGLLGKDSITITDITDVNPIRLDLASSQPIYQTKRASGYEPDYTSSPLIITPSLYFGQEEVNREKYIDKITFYINGVLVVNTGTVYVENTKLYIKENLNQNIKVEAIIENIIDERTKVEYERVSESLSFYLLSYDSSGYTAFIDSKDGRYDFSASNSSPITLSAHLYLGSTELTNVSYEWKRSSKPSEIYRNTKSITIARADIYSHENFICSMTCEGISYVATCAIDDRTDVYTGAIISDTSLVMTPILNTANLTCKIYRNGQEVTSDSIVYEWLYYTNNSTTGEKIGETKNILISLGSEKNPPKDSFSLYCIATIDNKYKVVSYLPISYSVSYTPILTPKTIFIPSNNDGSYQGEDKVIEKTLIFFLQGEDGVPIDADLTDFSISNSNSKGIIIGDSNVENKKYNIPFSINVSNFNNYNVSELFELSYTYKEHPFNEEFYIVKSIQGEAGENGSSYSLILSNDYHRFAGKEVYADEGQEVSTKISFFKGNEEMPLEVIKIGNNTTLTTEYKSVFTGLKAKLDKAGLTTEKMITFITTARELKEGGTIPIEIKVILNGEEKIFATVFQYDINYEGNSYFLSFTNGTSISYLPSKNTFTPDKLEFYAYYRQNGLGENKLYTDGRVYVSIDGKEKEYLPPKITGGAYYEYNKVLNIKNNITFYLYNSLTKTEGLKDVYLMDRETIPVLTSLEGAEIGGDNLLRFTRTLQEWDIQNSNKDTISINKDIDTNYATFNFNALTGNTSGNFKTCLLASPQFYIEKELENKTFCISFYFKNDSQNYFDEPLFIDGNIHASIYAYNGSNQLDSKSILYISNTNSNNAKVENEEIIEKGKWVRVYQTFNLNIFSSDVLSNATHYRIKIMGVISDTSNFIYNFSIKKPKLEVGNTLTSWSMATNDILFENLNVNLDNLNSQSLVEVLNNQIANLNTANSNISNIATGNISFSINTTDDEGNNGTKQFTNLADFSNYLNNNINKIIKNTNDSYSEINSSLNDLTTINGEFFELRNNIKLGYDDEQNFKPYLLFEVIGGEKKDKVSFMRLTTERLSFYSGKNELAYFGSNSMTIKRARVSEGYYLGSDATGYLVMKTTPQGCAFIWQSDKFDE